MTVIEHHVVIPAGNLKRIHADQQRIRSNALKPAAGKPKVYKSPVTVQAGGNSHKCDEVIIAGPSKMVYRPEKPLSCGARMWIETRAEVTTIVHPQEGAS